jgi:hypothetical protein
LFTNAEGQARMSIKPITIKAKDFKRVSLRETFEFKVIIKCFIGCSPSNSTLTITSPPEYQYFSNFKKIISNSIAEGDSMEIQISLCPHRNNHFHQICQIPPFLIVSFFNFSTNIEYPIYYFTGNVFSYSPARFSLNVKNNSGINIPDNFNVLFYGIAGATKSSFINSIISLLTPGVEVITRAPVGGCATHGTRALTRYRLNGDGGVTITLWDTLGLTKTTYQKDELDGLLEGKFPPGWKFSSNDSLPFAANHDCKIHSVIFFVPHSAFDNEEIVNLVKENCSKLKSVFDPILIISLTDQLDENIRTNPLKNVNYSLKSKAAEIFDISEDFIFLPVNYTEEHTKSFEIDRANYSILLETLRIVGKNFRALLEKGRY